MAIPGWTEEDIYLVADRGHALYLQGRYVEATAIFEGLVTIDSSNRYCRKALAALYMARGAAHRAVQHLKDVLAHDPGDIDARTRRCEAYLELNRLQEAQNDWQALKHVVAIPEVKRLKIRLETALRNAGGPKQQL